MSSMLFWKVKGDTKNKYSFKVYNSICNLQMLDKNENESKGKLTLDVWVNKMCETGTLRKTFSDAHLIPEVDLSFGNFEEFITKRKELLKLKLTELLNN